MHYYAVVERAADGGLGISFSGCDGITSWADDISVLVSQAQDALASVAMYGGSLPRSIEEGAWPPDDLSEFDPPVLVVVISFKHAGPA